MWADPKSLSRVVRDIAQEKLKTVLMQNFGGTTKSIIPNHAIATKINLLLWLSTILFAAEEHRPVLDSLPLKLSHTRIQSNKTCIESI